MDFVKMRCMYLAHAVIVVTIYLAFNQVRFFKPQRPCREREREREKRERESFGFIVISNSI
jgi:hypothetical protein